MYKAFYIFIRVGLLVQGVDVLVFSSHLLSDTDASPFRRVLAAQAYLLVLFCVSAF